MNILMFAHAGSNNHGCEAIVRSTCAMLGKHNYYLESNDWQSDKKFNLNTLAKYVEYKEKYIPRNSIKGLMMRVQARLSQYTYDDLESLERNKELLLKNSIAMSIGGDNYCYRGIALSMSDKLRAFRIKKIPTILWGCSIDKTYIDELILNDLKEYDLITARESLTIQNLQDLGISKNVVACVDPAFTLKRETVTTYDDYFANDEVIGINVSDFMKFYNSYPQATLNNFYSLISYIINNTSLKICLIPHVICEGNNDLLPIYEIKEHFNTDRILVVDKELNCMQLKDIIARCSVFIGCRTHSTIAAYSTNVPTLVVGYSTKAKGICNDIFGNEDNLIIDARDFSNDNDLLKCFLSFYEKRDELKKRLATIMPEYIAKAYNAKNALENKFINI